MKFSRPSKSTVLIIITILLTAAMVLIPFPSIVPELLVIFDLAFALGIFIYSRTEKKKLLPQLILYFSLFSVAVDAGITRFMVMQLLKEAPDRLIKFISTALSGYVYIGAFIFAVAVLGFQSIITFYENRKSSETAASWAQDKINGKLSEIENKVSDGEISEEDGEKVKQELKDNIEFYSRLDGSIKFFSRLTKIAYIFAVLTYIGCMTAGIFISGMPRADARPLTIKLTAVNILIYSVPLLIINLALK